jgi:ABC-type multidrug transport system fused ATPase/permease subunit
VGLSRRRPAVHRVELLLLTGIIVFLFIVNWKLALCVMLPIPIVIAVSGFRGSASRS